MSNKTIFTPFELKKFAFAEHNPTAFNFARWIESKSDKEYTVIERQFIIDSLEVLNKQTIFTSNLNDEFKLRWKGIITHL